MSAGLLLYVYRPPSGLTEPGIGPLPKGVSPSPIAQVFCGREETKQLPFMPESNAERKEGGGVMVVVVVIIISRACRIRLSDEEETGSHDLQIGPVELAQYLLGILAIPPPLPSALWSLQYTLIPLV